MCQRWFRFNRAAQQSYPQSIHTSRCMACAHPCLHLATEGGLAMHPYPEQLASPTLDHVLAQLKGVRSSLRGWRACCPAHGDLEPSLSIGLGEQGQVLL